MREVVSLLPRATASAASRGQRVVVGDDSRQIWW